MKIKNDVNDERAGIIVEPENMLEAYQLGTIKVDHTIFVTTGEPHSQIKMFLCGEDMLNGLIKV